jgi:hypothetical protein
MDNLYNLEKINYYRINEYLQEADNDRLAKEARGEETEKLKKNDKKKNRRVLLGFLGFNR